MSTETSKVSRVFWSSVILVALGLIVLGILASSGYAHLFGLLFLVWGARHLLGSYKAVIVACLWPLPLVFRFIGFVFTEHYDVGPILGSVCDIPRVGAAWERAVGLCGPSYRWADLGVLVGTFIVVDLRDLAAIELTDEKPGSEPAMAVSHDDQPPEPPA